jgi:hypothetical protein
MADRAGAAVRAAAAYDDREIVALGKSGESTTKAAPKLADSAATFPLAARDARTGRIKRHR